MMKVKGLLLEGCVHLGGLARLTREEMRLVGYPDSMPEIDVFQRKSNHSQRAM
jgi:hypothetical protein